MPVLRPSVVLLAIVALSSCAAPPYGASDLPATVELLRSADPLARDRGEEILAAIAVHNRELVWRVTDDPDPEIAARAYRVLEARQLLPDSEIERKARLILDELSAEMGERRENLVDELLSLGRPAALLLAGELNNRDLEPIVSPIEVSDGSRVVQVRGLGRNRGRVGLWVEKEQDALEIIGELSSTTGIRTVGPQAELSDEAEEQSLRQWLISSSRIPPGEVGAVWQHHRGPTDTRTGSYVLIVIRLRCFANPIRAELSGVPIEIPGTRFDAFPVGRVAILRERKCPEFRARVVRDGPRIGLQVTDARADDGTPHRAPRNKPWFAAIGDGGVVLAFGPASQQPATSKIWASGEACTTWLDTPLPKGTRKLWLGYDWGKEEGEQVIPPPIEFPDSAKPAGSE